MQIDDIDLQILHHLQNDARISNIDLADKVGLTPSPCLRRVKALEDQSTPSHGQSRGAR